MSYLIRNRVVTGVALSMCIGLASTNAGAQADEKLGDITRELKIMSKVLEASLDASGVDEWHAQSFGLSAFDSKIRSQYIPTVGAIFTLNVNFPIIQPEETETVNESATESDDLWEHFASGKDAESLDVHSSRIVGIGVSIRDNDDGEIEILAVRPNTPASSAGLKKGDVILRVDDTPTTEIEIEDIAKRIQGPVDSTVKILVRHEEANNSTDESVELMELERKQIQPSITWKESRKQRHLTNLHEESSPTPTSLGQMKVFMVDEGEFDIRLNPSELYFQAPNVFFQYDASKVATLRSTLLKAVGQYGHRMKKLKEGERLLLVVSAPKNIASRKVQLVTEASRLIFPLNEGSQYRDRMLLAFDQKDLTASTTPADIEKAATEQMY